MPVASLESQMLTYGREAAQAKKELVRLSSEVKDGVLSAMADALLAKEALLIAENAKDLEAGRRRGMIARAQARQMSYKYDITVTLPDGREIFKDPEVVIGPGPGEEQ